MLQVRVLLKVNPCGGIPAAIPRVVPPRRALFTTSTLVPSLEWPWTLHLQPAAASVRHGKSKEEQGRRLWLREGELDPRVPDFQFRSRALSEGATEGRGAGGASGGDYPAGDTAEQVNKFRDRLKNAEGPETAAGDAAEPSPPPPSPPEDPEKSQAER